MLPLPRLPEAQPEDPCALGVQADPAPDFRMRKSDHSAARANNGLSRCLQLCTKPELPTVSSPSRTRAREHACAGEHVMGEGAHIRACVK